MNKIVREHYPASSLPEDLRPVGDPNARVTVTIEVESAGDERPPEHLMTLEEIFSMKGFRRRTKEEIDEDLRRQRDEWER